LRSRREGKAKEECKPRPCAARASALGSVGFANPGARRSGDAESRHTACEVCDVSVRHAVPYAHTCADASARLHGDTGVVCVVERGGAGVVGMLGRGGIGLDWRGQDVGFRV
jgi:hypothetical protein